MKSMTGYGKGEVSEDGFTVVVELRAVNGRFLEVIPRIPRSYARNEDALSKIISKVIKRGSVEVMLSVCRPADSGKALTVDMALAAEYARLAKKLRNEFVIDDDFNVSALLRAPEVVKVESVNSDCEVLDQIILRCAELAVCALDQMRAVEGEQLAAELNIIIEGFRVHLQRLKERIPFVVEEYSSRLTERIKELAGDVEQTRLLTEVAIFADRIDINEELGRIESHLSQLASLLCQSGEIGKKIDFLLQELNREVNTIGSKSRDSILTSAVVEMKSQLEKLREQSRNIE